MRECAWCHGPIPSMMRRDAECCSVRCRQARHRFTSTVGSAGVVAHGQPRRLAYADPPYPGKSSRYYRNHPDYGGEVDHTALVASLSAEYDAWALSTSASALPAMLALCPPGVQVAAWHRGERVNRRATRPLNAWEPVIYWCPPRVVQVLDDASRFTGATRRVDSLVHVARPRLTDPARVVGAKPAAFCRWVFELLDAQPVDELVDVFPGSGGVGRAWESYVETSRRTTVERDASIAGRRVAQACATRLVDQVNDASRPPDNTTRRIALEVDAS